jgi:pyruvate formate lyase activating enzyme
VTQEEVIQMISSRRDFIDGVVITGGEPTLQPDLGDFIQEIKKTGVLIKLDTNGYHPEVLEKLLVNRQLNYIAMDIKTSWRKYKAATGVETDTTRLIRSIVKIKQAGIDFEFRTTCVPSLVDEEDITEISTVIGRQGRYTLQQFQSQSTLNPEYSKIEPYPRETLFHFVEIAALNVGSCRIVGL